MKPQGNLSSSSASRVCWKRIAMGFLAFFICVLLVVAFPFGLLMIVFESLFRAFHFWMLVAGELGAFTLVYAWLARKRRIALACEHDLLQGTFQKGLHGGKPLRCLRQRQGVDYAV